MTRTMIYGTVLAFAFGFLFVTIYNFGFERALQRVEKQNDTAKKAADKVRGSVNDCYDAGGLWDVVTGNCKR